MSSSHKVLERRGVEKATSAKSCRYALMLVIVCAGISILPPFFNSASTWADFRAIYVGTRCLLSGHNPYQVSEANREYRSEDGLFPPEKFNQSITLYVNLPTTLVLLAPIAWMPWGPAHLIWMTAVGAAFLLGLILVWRLGASYSLEASTFLTCVLAVNCETIFMGGNTGGLVVGLCAIAVWCFLRERFVCAGVLCLALSLAIKPHDSGFVWLFFLLTGGIYRKRALHSLAVTAVLALMAVLWVSHVAPHWWENWRANLATIAAPGGINDASPNVINGDYPLRLVDIQGVVSIFRDDPSIYNLTSYLICGPLLLLWSMRSLRSRYTEELALLALASATAFTLLITYHRLWDAKLVMLAIPACSMLWAGTRQRGKAAALVTFLNIVLTGDLMMGALAVLFKNRHPAMDSFTGKLLDVLILRPASVALLGMGIFYLWVYLRPVGKSEATECSQEGVL